jgi:hypothetical protein
MSAEAPPSFPISWVSKNDLFLCRPDLTERIRALDESEVEYIAEKIGDALQETYWLTMSAILDDYFGENDSEGITTV